MKTGLIKKYRAYLIVIAAVLVVISGYFVKDTFSYLTQKDQKIFDAQIGSMELEILLNDVKPSTKWEEVPIAVKLIGGTKINEDDQFNKAVMPATITLTNTEDIPLNMSFDLVLPEMTDNGFLYMVLPYDVRYPTSKDYKNLIFSNARLSGAPTYDELKSALAAYNATSLETYKSDMSGGKFTPGSYIYKLDANGGEKYSSQINILFWAEYDKLNLLQNYETPNYNDPKDYHQLNLNFSLKIAIRQIQDDVFDLLKPGGSR